VASPYFRKSLFLEETYKRRVHGTAIVLSAAVVLQMDGPQVILTISSSIIMSRVSSLYHGLVDLPVVLNQTLRF
jgi:hypothetical protein